MPPSDGPLAARPLPVLGGVLRRTAHQSVLDTLRKAILGGSLEAGTPLVQSELSAQLGVSKTPIREAIRDLAAEGLIDFDSYRSSVVHTPTLEETRQVYELRLLLEPLAVEKAIGHISTAALDEADAVAAEMVHTTDIAEWVDLNQRFHTLLLDPRAAPLNGIVIGLRTSAAIQLAWSLNADPSQMVRADGEHGEIVAAYRREDLDAAVSVTIEHLRGTLEAIEDLERARTAAAAEPR